MKKRLLALAMTLALTLGMMTIPTAAANYSIKQLEGGYDNAFVVTQDGTLYGCGLNEQGVLGPDVATEIRDGIPVVPTLQKIAEGVKEVAACEEHVIRYYKNPYDQGNHILILMENGDLYTQGDNLYAQLGQNDREVHEGMQYVMSNVVAIAAGGYFSACVTEDGDLYWWGYLVQQQGSNQVANTFDPELVGTGFVDVDAGVCTLIALKEDGTVWTMGSSAYGARGDGTTQNLTREPQKVFSGAVEIASGANHSLVRTASGDVYGWGENQSGQLRPHELEGDYAYDSDGYVIDAPVLLNEQYTTPVFIMGGAKAIDASYDNSFVLKKNGDLWGMGTDYDGQLGLNVQGVVTDPQFIATNVNQVSAGYRASYILKENGSTYAAGNNYYYNFGSGARMYNERKWTPCFFTACPIQEEGSMTFTDVNLSDYFYDAVQWALDNNITSGTSATTFSPNMTCSRAHIITFLWAAAGKTDSMGLNWFVDVDQYSWYYKAVCWAQDNPLPADGAITPSSFNAKFYPNDPCSRAMAVEFMWRYAGQPEYDTSNLPFTDVKPTDSYAQAVAWALDNGITSGTSATTFSPNATCIRGQISTFLYKAFG